MTVGGNRRRRQSDDSIVIKFIDNEDDFQITIFKFGRGMVCHIEVKVWVVVKTVEFDPWDKLKDLRKKLVLKQASGIILIALDEVQVHILENEIEIQEYTTVSSDAILLATDELDVVSPTRLL
ncbi:hypothetical protein JHK85_007375 [Glycine max]|nr:hypothetical protein JHK85_007375 [Glycine max]KAG5071953.1 hypothetical protein JHK86_007164 [Glycine max]